MKNASYHVYSPRLLNQSGRVKILLLVLTLVSVLAGTVLAKRYFANPQITQGGSASFPSTGTLAPASGLTWDIIDSSSARIATNTTTNGWTVSLSGSTFTVGAPGSATVEANYTVRYNTQLLSNVVKPTKGKAQAIVLGWGPSEAPVHTRTKSLVLSGSKSALFDVVAGSTPPAPTNLTATALSGTQIYLTWQDSSTGLTGYQLYRSQSPTGTFTPVGTPGPADHSCTDSGLAPSTTYYYYLVAKNAAGNSPNSNVASATTTVLQIPAAPSNLLATPISSYQITLTWTDNSNNETNFLVERLGADGITWGQIGTTQANVTTYPDSGLTPNTTYSYRVRASNADGKSGYTNVAVTTTPNGAATPPGTMGTDFWVAFPPSGPPTSGLHTLAVLITSPYAATGTVTIASTGSSTPFTIPAGGGETEVPISSSLQTDTADGITTAGIHVASNVPVAVSALNSFAAASSAFTALPTPTLGTNYVQMSYPTDPAAGVVKGPQFYSQLVVMATVANTSVTVVPSCTVGTHTQGVPYVVTLNAGQAYTLQTTQILFDLTGSSITANQPVAVYAGCEGADVPMGTGYGNPLIQQEPSVDRWGTDFYAAPFATRTGGDMLRILSPAIGTNVYINGVLTSTLDENAVVNVSLPAASHITSNNPILVAQLSRGAQADGNANADPFMLLVTPSAGYSKSSMVAISNTGGYLSGYVSMIVPTSAVGDVTLDGGYVPTSYFTAITGSAYSSASVPVNPGGHIVSTATTGAPVYAYGYGFASYDGYGLPGSSSLPANTVNWTPPAAPSNLVATAVSTSEIDLTWANNATNATGVVVEIQPPNGSWTPLVSVGPTINSWHAQNLAIYTQYNFRVRAFTNIYSLYSNIATATTWDNPPNTPVLTATPQQYLTIQLNWTESSTDVTGGFFIQKLGADGVTWTTIATPPQGTTTINDTNLAPLTTYTYRMYANNAFGNSGYSTNVSAKTFDSPPNAPTNLAATAPAWNTVSLTWHSNSTNETGFSIEREQAGGSFTAVGTAPKGSVGYTDTYLLSGATTYTYRVRAYNLGGYSGYSNSASVTTPPPPPPTGSIVLSATALDQADIKLTWTSTVTGQDGYMVQVLNNGIWQTIGQAQKTDTSFTATNLAPSTTYTYQIYAYNAGGNSSPSNSASATTMPPPTVSPPGFVEAIATSASSIRIYFSPLPGASSYRIYRATTSGGQNLTSPIATIPSITGTEHFYDDHNLTAYQDYYYVVTGVFGPTESGPSYEDSHYPNPGAIPWDQSSPQIISAVLATLNTEPDLPFSVPPGNTSISTPDGTLLEDGPAGAALVGIDSANWVKIVGSYTLPVTQPVWVTPTPQGTKTTKQGGAFRRVLAKTGAYTGTTGWVSLPVSTDTSNFAVHSSPTTGNTDTPGAFVGLHSGNVEVDAGVEFNPAVGTFPDRWSPFLNVQANGKSTGYPNYSFTLGSQSLDKTNSRSFISASSIIGNSVFLGVFLNPNTRMLRFYCFAVDANGMYVATSLNSAAQFKVYGNQPLNNIDMKRVVAIPQTIKLNSAANTGSKLWVPAPPGASGVDNTSYFPSGSLCNFTWSDARLYTGGNYVLWSATDTSRTVQNYGTPFGTTSFTGDQSNASSGEFDKVHN